MPTSPSADDIVRHPIAVVAERTGISQDLLRMWERRYAAVQPTRTPGGERLYSDADVERLRLIDRALAGGRRIGQVAGLPSSELAALVEADRAAATDRAPRLAIVESDQDRGVVDAAMRHVSALDGTALDAVLRRSVAVHGTDGFIARVAVPLLRRIGDEWHGGRLAIAEEHLASAVVESIVLDAMRTLRAAEGSPSLLVAAPSGSRHVIAAAMAGAVAAAEGWNVVFLGGDLPVTEIASSARARNVHAVALSILYMEREELLLGALRTLRETLPTDMPLIVGGAALASIAPRMRIQGITFGETLGELRTVLRALLAP